MAFTGFALVLVCWVLFSYKMGFGTSWTGAGHGILHNFIGKPGTVLSHEGLQSQANIPPRPLTNPAVICHVLSPELNQCAYGIRAPNIFSELFSLVFLLFVNTVSRSCL